MSWWIVGPGKLADEYVHASTRKISEVMTSEVHTVSENAPLDDVITTMEQNHIKRVPVMYREKLVGIVTRTDLLRALINAAKPRLSSADDGTIRGQSLSHLAQQKWAPVGTIDVAVRNGNVTFSGFITDEENAGLYVRRQKIFRASKASRISPPGWYPELE